MTTAMQLELPPRVQDITAGRPYRLVGIPLPAGTLVQATYHLEITANNEYGATVLFYLGPELEPIFELTGQQTAQLGTLLAAARPCGYDNAGGATSVGWYQMTATGADPKTTEMTQYTVGHGPVLVRLNQQLVRKDRILLGQGTCGCVQATTCGCGTGCSTCDHPPVTDEDLCNVLTKRAMVKGRWRGPYSDLDPPDNLGPYVRYDVVQMPDGTQYAYVGPADGKSECWAPGQTVGPTPW